MDGLDPVGSQRGSSRKEEEAEARREILLASLAYVPVLLLVPIVISGSTEFLGFHKRQGLLVFVAEMAAAMAWFLPEIGPALSVALAAAIAIAVMRAIDAVWRHTTWEAPVIGAAARWLNL